MFNDERNRNDMGLSRQHLDAQAKTELGGLRHGFRKSWKAGSRMEEYKYDIKRRWEERRKKENMSIKEIEKKKEK